MDLTGSFHIMFHCSGDPKVLYLAHCFLCYINDMPFCIQYYIRANTISRGLPEPPLRSHLTRIMAKVLGHCFYQDKCNIIRMTRTKHPILHNYTLKGRLVAVINAEYLGVTLNGNLTWNNHIGSIANAGIRTLGSIRRNNQNTLV